MHTPTHPIPMISWEQKAANEDRDLHLTERCFICGRGLRSKRYEVVTYGGADAIDLAWWEQHADEALEDPDFLAAYSGAFLVGSTCARKIPARFRRLL